MVLGHLGSSVQFSHLVVSDCVTPWTAACQASLSITNSGACSNSCPLGQWRHPTISSSAIPFSSCIQSFPASGSFLRVSSLHQVAKVLELQFHHQSFQWIGIFSSLGILEKSKEVLFRLLTCLDTALILCLPASTESQAVLRVRKGVDLGIS